MSEQFFDGFGTDVTNRVGGKIDALMRSNIDLVALLDRSEQKVSGLEAEVANRDMKIMELDKVVEELKEKLRKRKSKEDELKSDQ